VTARPVSATDAEIEDALAYADPMALRGLLFQLTGDESLAAMKVEPRPLGFSDANVLVDEDDVAQVRATAAALLRSIRDGGGEVSTGPPERLPRSLALAAGEEIPERGLGLWLEELALDPWARGLQWRERPPPERLEDFSVLVIGAGMGGLNAAVLLRHAGIPFTVVEKNPGVGGTWHENRYPGARVDSPSRTYMHIFGADYSFSSTFCTWDENEAYFNWVADHFDVRRDIVFETEVTSCTWDEESATWLVRANGPEGAREWRADVVISAVGFLSRPNVPSIEGSDEFAGDAFHTARWPEGYDLTGKRVAVIGSACSGYQAVPELALVAAHVSLFQRTPQWVIPIPGYRSELPPQVGWLDRNVPLYVNFMRFRSSWLAGPQRADSTKTIDPTWADPDSCSAGNRRMRDFALDFLRRKLAGRPELIEAMTPPHPAWSARPVMMDDAYCIFDALLRDDVSLVTAGIRRITRDGIETADGAFHPADVIVYATGFRANDYLWPMEIRGRAGVRLAELWAEDGPRAYLGCMLPGFPNLFLLYGPNTNPMGGLGIVNLEEMMTRQALQCIERLVLDDEVRSIDVAYDAYRSYNDALDRRERGLIYGQPTVRNYYRSEWDRSAVNCPFWVDEMWRWLRSPDYESLVLR
jgi:4-hydroxyacetophenone monooxygenase